MQVWRLCLVNWLFQLYNYVDFDSVTPKIGWQYPFNKNVWAQQTCDRSNFTRTSSLPDQWETFPQLYKEQSATDMQRVWGRGLTRVSVSSLGSNFALISWNWKHNDLPSTSILLYGKARCYNFAIICLLLSFREMEICSLPKTVRKTWQSFRAFLVSRSQKK